MGVIAIEEFIGSKPKIYSILVSNSTEFKKAKCVNKSHNEYEDILLHKKCLTHLMNRIQSQNHRIEAYEINNKS